MKRIFCLIFSLLLLLSLSGCFSAAMRPKESGQSDLQIVTQQQAEQSDPGTTAPAETTRENPTPDTTREYQAPETTQGEALLDENGWYNTKEEVALYIHQYGKLPGNYITKKEAQALGWPGGSLEPYAPGKSIGGSYFGNYEGILPTAKGRKYTECDIDTAGKKSRGSKRIVFSNDGLIYYTEDHYETFELLYGSP